MELILAIIASLLLGGILGSVLSKLKNQGLLATIEQQKWQLESERSNAQTQISNLQQQLLTAKADYEERMEQVKADSKNLLAIQERNHEQALKAQAVKESKAPANMVLPVNEKPKKPARKGYDRF